MSTVNFQTLKLVLEKAEEPEIKLPTSTGSSKKQESSRKTPISALLNMPKPLTVWITTNYGKLVKIWEDETTLHVKEQQLELGMEQLVKNWEESSILPLCLFNFYADYITGNKRMDESPARNKIARRNNNNIR